MTGRRDAVRALVAEFMVGLAAGMDHEALKELLPLLRMPEGLASELGSKAALMNAREAGLATGRRIGINTVRTIATVLAGIDSVARMRGAWHGK